MDLRKLNETCVHNPFPTPFTDEVLENVGSQEAYSFTDGFSGYHQINIALKDRSKTTFTTEWGCFQYTVMPFGLKNASSIFSHIMVATFKEYIHKFFELYLDDWTIFGLVKHHVASLCLMLDTYCRTQIALNLKKCTFLIPSGSLLGHVVCKQGLMVDPGKIFVILNLEALQSVKELRATLGHTGWKFIKSYAKITESMEKILKTYVTYFWNDDCMKSLDVLKGKLASAPILVFPKWDVEFHVHVDVSCIVLGEILT